MQPPDPDPRYRSAVTIAIAGIRLSLATGERILIGREGDPRMASGLSLFENVGRRHVWVTAGDDTVEVEPLGSLNGTYLGDHLLEPGLTRTLPLPVTIRLARNCFVRLEVTGE